MIPPAVLFKVYCKRIEEGSMKSSPPRRMRTVCVPVLESEEALLG
jgi:hypothetical protein